MSDIFESKWGETKAALTEGLAGNKKKTMDVVLETRRDTWLSSQLLVPHLQVTLLR